jgi:SPP1 family phage portal protein
MILRDRKFFNNGVTKETLESCFAEHIKDIAKLNLLDDYYKGRQKILFRESKGEFAPNNKIVCNFAKYITDSACGYFAGNPISYIDETGANIEDLIKTLKKARSNSRDAELEKDLSIFGRSYELLYMSNDETPEIKLGLIDPRNAFVVSDTTVEAKPIFGAYYFPKITLEGKQDGFNITVCDENNIYSYENASAFAAFAEFSLIDVTRHYFGGVPLIEYKNNEEASGDFEGVISLIDAYNLLQSDRTNDKERFVDAILVIINAQLDSTDARELAVSRILQLPGDSSAGYITKTLNEGDVQILARALKDDIHKFSQTPDFTDENFASNSSGVAMAYKLLSIENLAKIKERFFIEGLKQRLFLIANILKIKGGNINPDNIKIVIKRALPVNELELAQLITTLKGTVSTETLISKLPFVENVQEELLKAKEERDDEDARVKDVYNVRENIDNENL